jgi:hypothetical protein
VAQSYHFEGGLFSRVLWFKADLAPTELQSRKVVRDAARTAALTKWGDFSAWLDGQAVLGEPHVVQISDDVYDLFNQELFERWRTNLVDDRDRVNSARLRALNYAETIAGLYALSCCRWKVTENDAIAAINLVEQCVETLSGLDRTVAIDVQAKLRERVLVIIDSHAGGCPKSAIYAATRASKTDLDIALATLLDADAVTREVVRSGGRPSESFRRKT